MRTTLFVAVSALSLVLAPLASGEDAKVEAKPAQTAKAKKAGKKGTAKSCACSDQCMKDCQAGQGKDCKCTACDCAQSKECGKGCTHKHADGKACDHAAGEACEHHKEGEAEHKHEEGEHGSH